MTGTFIDTVHISTRASGRLIGLASGRLTAYVTSAYLTSAYLTSAYLTSAYVTSAYLACAYVTTAYVTSAPGSKTLQLLDALHRPTPHAPGATPPPPVPAGLLVANELCPARAVRTARRASAARCAPLMLTRGDGRALPPLRAGPGPGGRAGRFDRILCDVPCSGDGTLRKNRHKWAGWGPGPALANHGVQVCVGRGLGGDAWRAPLTHSPTHSLSFRIACSLSCPALPPTSVAFFVRPISACLHRRSTQRTAVVCLHEHGAYAALPEASSAALPEARCAHYTAAAAPAAARQPAHHRPPRPHS
jgi:hypothetical protein